MANRYGRDIGRRDREGFGRNESDREGFSGRSIDRSRAYGSTAWGEDESYFGGSRQFGSGYSSGSGRDFDTYERDYGSENFGSMEYPDRAGGSYGSDYEGGSGRYSQGNERSQGYGSDSRGRYSRGGGGYAGGYSGGGAYSGGGYSGGGGGGYSSGYSNRGGSSGGSRYEDRYSNRSGSENYGDYRLNYPMSSERGWANDRDEGGNERGWWDRTADEVASWFGDDDAARRRRMDNRGGGHRGRGPSGYTRSDDRVREDINDRLTDYDYIDATNISVEVQGGDVTLTGTVDSRYEKRLAEDIAEDVSGVRNVENRLRVSSSSRMNTYAGTNSGLTTSAEQTGSVSETTTGNTPTSTASGTQAKSKSSGT